MDKLIKVLSKKTLFQGNLAYHLIHPGQRAREYHRTDKIRSAPH